MATSNTKDNRKWYQKKRIIVPGLVLAGLIALVGSGNNPQPVDMPVQSTTLQDRALPPSLPAPTFSQKAPSSDPAPQTSDQLSNDNYYTNVDGNEIHSPAYSNSVPAGASAQCRDGTYSFNQHRSGTCSHHGGVTEWL